MADLPDPALSPLADAEADVDAERQAAVERALPWIEFLRDTGSPVCIAVEDLLDDDIAICDPISMEVLAGARSEAHLAQLRGLLARAVVVIGADDVVKYVQLVPEVVQEPDYEAALAAAR